MISGEHNVGDITPLDHLEGLTPNTLRRTRAAGLVVVADVKNLTVPELGSISGMGQSTVANLIEVLSGYGFTLEGSYESPRSKARQFGQQNAKWRAKRGKIWQEDSLRILSIARGEQPTLTTSDILMYRTLDETAVDELSKVLRRKVSIDFSRFLLLASGLLEREQLVGEHLQVVDQTTKLGDEGADLEEEIEWRLKNIGGSLSVDADIYQVAFEAQTLFEVNRPLAEERRRQDFPDVPFTSWAFFAEKPISRPTMQIREFLNDPSDPIYQLVLDYYYRHGATQDQLAALFGKTQPTIGRYIAKFRLQRPLIQALLALITEVEYGKLGGNWQVLTNPDTIRSQLPPWKIDGKEHRMSELAMPTAMVINTTGLRPPVFLKVFPIPYSWPEGVTPGVRVATRSERSDWMGEENIENFPIADFYGKDFPDYLILAEPTGKVSSKEVSVDLPNLHLEGTSGSILNYTFWPYGCYQNNTSDPDKGEGKFVSCIGWSNGMISCHPPTLIPQSFSVAGTSDVNQVSVPPSIRAFIESFEKGPESISAVISKI